MGAEVLRALRLRAESALGGNLVGAVIDVYKRQGQEAIALVKASAVVLVADFAGWQLSARNQFAGTVSRIEQGTVSSLVVLTLPGGALITASVTRDAVAALGLAVGQAVTAAFKAYSVVLVVPG